MYRERCVAALVRKILSEGVEARVLWREVEHCPVRPCPREQTASRRSDNKEICQS